MRYALVVTIAACGGVPNLPETEPQPAPRARAPAQQPESSCKRQPPIGDASLQTVHDLPGFAIAAPETCRDNEAYIRIERLAGSRQLATASREGCIEPAKFTTCSKLNVGAVLELVRTELVNEHFDRPNLGTTPCGGNPDDWKFTIGVHDWKNVDRLIAKIGEVFDRYDLKGFVGVAVAGTPCFRFL